MPFVSTGKINYSGFSDKSVLESMLGGGSETPSAKSRYVFVGNDYKQYVTSDFSEWTTIDTHVDKKFSYGCYSKDHDLFVLGSGIRNTKPYWTTDLTTMEQCTINTEDTFDFYFDPRYIPECQLFCAEGFKNQRELYPMFTSKDGKTWTVHGDDSTRSSLTRSNFVYMEHLNRIVSVAYSTGDIVYSDNQGESWIKTTVSDKYPTSGNSRYPLCYNKNDQFIYGWNSNNKYNKLILMKSTDGLVWEDFITIPTTNSTDTMLFQQYVPEAGKVFFVSGQSVGTYSNDGTYHFVAKSSDDSKTYDSAMYDPVAGKMIVTKSDMDTDTTSFYTIDYTDMINESYTTASAAPTLQPIYQLTPRVSFFTTIIA